MSCECESSCVFYAGHSYQLTFCITDCATGEPLDLSTASALAVIGVSPSNTTISWVASLRTDGIDGKLTYETSAMDLSESGSWDLYGYAVIDGRPRTTSVARIEVRPNPVP